MSEGVPPVLQLSDIRREYKTRAGILPVLTGVDLEVLRGQIIGLIGPSGSGKSSLLHVAGLLEAPQNGSVSINGIDASGANDQMRTALRRDLLGFVYQFHNLLPEFDALENVLLPAEIAGRSMAEAREFGKELLDRVGLSGRMSHRPAELSGGEQQRVAIARALINRPKLIIADEPTGNLDPKTSRMVFDLFAAMAADFGAAALVATHNYELAGLMGRVVRLENGKLLDGLQ